MEDVVLHFQSGSADGLGDLLDTTERLLQPFNCRPPPAFRPWFTTGRHPPIRPARPAPIIHQSISPASVILIPKPAETGVFQSGLPEHEQDKHGDHPQEEGTRALSEDGVGIPESPASVFKAASPDKHKHPEGFTIRRSWSVFPQGGAGLHSSQSLSKQFHHVVSKHRLHFRQRARWIICQQNCEDLEQVWQILNRSVQSSVLPTCNANIQRERAEIWIFCDVLYSEQVGRFLKEGLQLSGRISLSVHRLGNIFSM